MALTSPGVEVTVIDESNYLPAATNSVPFIMIATAQNKISGTGTGVAAGTTAANANILTAAQMSGSAASSSSKARAACGDCLAPAMTVNLE